MSSLRVAFLAVLLAHGTHASAQDSATPPKPKVHQLTAALTERAYDAAKEACIEILGVKAETLPPLAVVEKSEVAAAVAAENLPVALQREPDEAKARALADGVGQQIAIAAFAKYSWSQKRTLVVLDTWQRQARVLRDPEMTSEEVVKAVLVHELCHAVADAKFDLTERLETCDTADAAQAFNAVLEGHAQMLTRRVCTKKGWNRGFEVFTKAIGAIPDLKVDEATRLQMQAESTQLLSTYRDGETFVTAVVAARPEKGEEDLFRSPPRDMETILHPEWYLDPSKRPLAVFDLAPVLDAFVANFDASVWTSQRNDVTGQQLASGLTMIPKAEVDAIAERMRTATMVQLHPTASPQSKIAYLIALEFTDEKAARAWIAMTGRVSEYKDETMDKGILRITGSKTTPIEQEGIFGLLQEKKMKNGRLVFDVATIDACNGPVVIETLYSGEPPTADVHIALVKELLTKVAKR